MLLRAVYYNFTMRHPSYSMKISPFEVFKGVHIEV